MSITFNGVGVKQLEQLAKEVKYVAKDAPTGKMTTAIKEKIGNVQGAEVAEYIKAHASVDPLKEVSADKLAEAYRAAHGIF